MKDTNNQGKSFQERLAEAEERRKNATISDIIAAKRREADSIEASARGSFKAGEDWDERPFTESDLESALDLAETKRKEADRLEAAHKRERGDCAKLREALKAISGLCDRLIPTWDGAIGRIKDIAEAALAAPPRNCDVGTAKEQDERFHRFCKCHRTGSCAGCHNPVGDYTVANGVRECALAWAQMPYEEGGAK